MCVLIVRVQKCECMIQNVDTENLNVYMNNKFQGRLNDYNFHLFPLHRFSEFFNACVSKKQ